MLRLKNNKPNDICVNDMEDGDIGVITQWSCGDYVNQVVQRYKNYLLVVGAHSEWGWDTSFNYSNNRNEQCRVRLLEKGEELVVG